MGVDHAMEKRNWEREALRLFLSRYNPTAANRYRLLFQQEKPDAVLEDGRRRKLGVEITHLFYSQEEAKRVFGHDDPPEPRGPESFGHLLSELNVLIRRKEVKRQGYSMEYPIALLIRNASPGFGMKDFLARQDEVYIPQGGFVHIWFLSRDGGDEWLLTELL